MPYHRNRVSNTIVSRRKSSRCGQKFLSSIEHLEQRQLLSTSVLTYRNDVTHDGVNATETTLTPANVKVGSFGKLYTTALDGSAYAQPLVVSGETINPGVNTTAGISGTFDTVYVETENDSIYAVSTLSGTVLWQRSFLNTVGSGTTPGTDINNTLSATAISAPTSTDVSCTDITPTYGITGTPVIDLANNRMYVVAFTKEMVGGVATFVQRLHAINLSDGTDVVAPYLIGATTGTNTNTTNIYVYGDGDGAVTDPYNNTGNPVVQFNALRENQRASLSLVNGVVYVSYASHCDDAPYHGWVVSWNVANLTTSGFVLNGVFCTSPNGGAAGIWGGGGGLSFDPDVANTFYFETGNGFGAGNGITLDAAGFPTGGSYYEAVVRVTTDPTTSPTNQNTNGWGFKVVDYFIPYNQGPLDNADQDLGSGSPLVLPDSAGIPGHPHLLAAAGKQGVIYLIDRDNMGKYSPENDNVINSVPNGSGNNTPPVNVTGVLSTPVYYNNTLYYVSGYSGTSISFTISSSGKLVPTSQTAVSSFGYLPGSPSLSSDGSLNGIIWQTDRNTNELHAYDASSYATELWNSSQKANNADAVGTILKFASPTVANGEVFVGTANSLVAYGLTPPASAVPAAPVLSVTPLSGSSVNLTWVDTTGAPNFATAYLIEQSTDGVNFTQITTAAATATSLAVGGLNANTKYYFRIRSQNSVGFSAYSSIVSVTTTNQVAAVLDGSFESTSVNNGYTYDPSSAYWTFTGDSGIQANGSAWNAAIAPNGTKTAFLQSTGSVGGTISQTIPFSSAGTFQFTFQAAQRANYGLEPIAVSIDGSVIDTVSPASSSFTPYTTPAINLSAGSHILTFSTATITSGDDASFLDSVALVVNSIASAPNAPSALGAIPASATSISLSWTANSTNQTGYLLDRATDPAFTQNLITQTLPATPGSYTDTAIGLASGGTYYYRIRATNSAGSSDNSNVASVSIPFAPARASDCVFDSVTTTSISLQWTDNAGPTATGYHILRSIGNGPFSLYTTLPGLTTTSPAGYSPTEYDWTDTGLSPGTTYNYHIQAFNVAGYNDFVGGYASTLTTAPVVTLGSSAGDVTLSWIAPLGATGYNVYRGTTPGGEAATPLAADISATTYTDTSAIPGTTYYYTVTALNGNAAPLNGESAASNEVPVSVASTASLPAPWISGDVGAPTLQGSSNYANGVFTVAGSGSDIWNASDQFQFVNTPVTGNAAIVARVDSQTNTNPWAKAGVMYRSTAAANSPFVSVVQTPSNGVNLEWRDASGNLGNTPGPVIAGLAAGAPVWVMVVREGNLFTGLDSADGVNWNVIGSTSIAMPAASLGGLAVSSHDVTKISTATFDQLAISTMPQSGWTAGDIGTPALTGSSIFANGAMEISGSGADIWNTSDQFQFADLAVTGDQTIVARVISQTNTNAWAKAGVMFRSTSAATSAYVDVVLTPSNGIAMQYRDASGNQGTFPATVAAGPVWVKLVRSGNVFTGFDSANGISWNLVGSITISLPAPGLIGLAVSSHDVTQISTAVFDNISVVAGSTSSAAEPSGLTATPAVIAGSGQIDLSWTAGAGDATYNIYRGTASGQESTIPIATGITATTYTDNTAIPGVSYYYYVNAQTASAGSPNIASPASNEAVTTITVVKLTGTPIGTQTSFLNNGDTIAQVFDGNLNTYFDAPNNSLTNWVGLDLGQPETISQIRYAPRAGYEFRMYGGQFQVSSTANFSSNVLTLYTISSIPVAGQLTTVSVNPGGQYRYVRFVGGTQWVNIAEMEVDGLPASPTYVKLTGTVIGTQTSWLNNGDTIAQVFDGNFNTYFDAPNNSLTNWVGLDLGSPQVISQIKFAPRAGYEFRMYGGEFQASSTPDFSSNVVTLYTVNAIPTAGQFTSVLVNPGAAYRYVRYVGGTQWVNIAEMEVDATEG